MVKIAGGITEKPDDAMNPEAIMAILRRHRGKIKQSLQVCAHCALCAESCFMFQTKNRHYKYMPAYKLLNSLGLLFRKKGRVTRSQLETIRDIVWNDCVLCSRCYCPFGIDIPHLLSIARQACRSQNVYPDYSDTEVLNQGIQT